MSHTATILETMRGLGHAVTPTQLHDFLLSRGVSIKRGTVKRILYRLWERGQLRKDGPLYFFARQGDSFNHSGGQKGTTLRGINHSKESGNNYRVEAKRGQKNDWNDINHSLGTPSITRRVGAIFYNFPNDTQTIVKLVRRLRDVGANYRTVQSAINYLQKRGIIKRVRRGVYKLADAELAYTYLSRGTPKPPYRGQSHYPL